MYTIGIVGSDSLEVAKFYTKLVEVAAEMGIQRDQDHPPAIVCGMKMDTPESMMDAYKLTAVFGASFIVSTDSLTKRELIKIQSELGTIKILYPLNDNVDELVSIALKDAFNDIESLHEENGGFSYLGDKKSWENSKNGKELKKLSEVIESKNLIGVIGGAGTLAGAHFCERLAKHDVSFIMLSDTTAPDKNNALVMGGKDFLQRYQADIKLLRHFVTHIAIPCNTAHIKKATFCGTFLKEGDDDYARLVDIGEATIKNIKASYPQSEDIIFLGTPATMNDPNSAFGPDKLKNAKINAIKPNYEQLNKIYQAIYKVKGYKSDKIIEAHRRGEDITKMTAEYIEFSKLKEEAKELILEVVEELRGKNGDDTIPVALVCTELPVVFTQKELIEYRLISSTDALAKLAAFKQKTMSYERDNPNNIIKLSSVKELSDINDSKKQEDYNSDSSYGEEFDLHKLDKQYKIEALQDSNNEGLEEIVKQYKVEARQDSKKTRIYFLSEKTDDKEITKKIKCHQDMKVICDVLKVNKVATSVHLAGQYISIDNKYADPIFKWLKDSSIDIVQESKQLIK